MKTNDEKEIFYMRCSEILGIEHTYNQPVPRRTRWNTRLPGNGRYPTFGTIQCFGTTIRVMNKTHGTKFYKSYDEVYTVLEEYKRNTTRQLDLNET